MGHVAARRLGLGIAGRMLLRDVDFEALPGDFVAIVGPNGVGKTTLLRALAGVHRPSAGMAWLDGVPAATMSSVERARSVSLLAGDPAGATALSVREAVTIGRYAHHAWWDWRRSDGDDAAVREALGRVDLLSLADRSLRTLSSGERARVWVALALAQAAGTLLLDEPTSHLDVAFAHEVLGLLRALTRSGSTVVAVLHDLNEAAAYADRIAVLAPGQILCYGVPRSALDPSILETAYGLPFLPLETACGYRVLAASAP